MLQVVRRQKALSSSSFANKVLPFSSRKERFLEIAFVSLASANIFVIASATALYYLAHKH
jgi:hypothetical protein